MEDAGNTPKESLRKGGRAPGPVCLLHRESSSPANPQPLKTGACAKFIFSVRSTSQLLNRSLSAAV